MKAVKGQVGAREVGGCQGSGAGPALHLGEAQSWRLHHVTSRDTWRGQGALADGVGFFF